MSDVVITALQRVGLLGEAPSHADVSQAVQKFQAIHGLIVDGEAGPVTQRELARPRFCAVPDRLVMDATQKCRWDHTRWNGTSWNERAPAAMLLRWHVTSALPGFSVEQTFAAFAEALSYWEAVCAVKFVRDESQPNLWFNIRRIDRASGTLAWQTLPCGQDSPSTRLEGRYDSDEPWVISESPGPSKIDAVRVICHEAGHGIGLDHGPEGALLAPYYDRNIRRPQEWDIKEAQHRYGPPIVGEGPVVPAEGHAVVMIGVKRWEGELREA